MLTKFNRPVTAFLSFENEEGINRMKEYNETVHNDDQFADIKTFLGQELQIEDASEPTDIIWENRHFTSMDRFKRTIIVIIAVFFLLFISFLIIFFCSGKAAAASLKYPSTNCTAIAEDFNDEQLQQLAFQEFFFNRESPDFTTEKPVDQQQYGAYLQCFCKDAKNNSMPAD
jgi:hypothetical protein